MGELKENWGTMIIKDPPIQKKPRKQPIKKNGSQNLKRKANTKSKAKIDVKTNQNQERLKKNKTEKQKKVKLKWAPMEKLKPGHPPPSFDGSLAELIPRSSNPLFTPDTSVYYSSSIIKHFTAPCTTS